ncbi:hypothetical protein [Parasphingopyxis marina]|uniref:Uncharacterized protein n=1 Tax=Parasphingopyxis marina TaxID=2761622 RepID=A0A842HV82_9SPHN|nr:hypothetical protein [Parasphingopyxis marina]MBC2776423.1 hypothetical protein [Parasphingopyxis marina]
MSLIRNIARTALGSAVTGKTAGRGLLGAGIGLIATRIATRSLPGAAVVGGGLIAKYLWDRRREAQNDDEAFGEEDAEMGEARATGETDIADAASPERDERGR